MHWKVGRFFDNHFGKVLFAVLAGLLGLMWWLLREQDEAKARDCVAVCQSHGHERFPTDTAACFCAGPEGAYSPGLSEAQPSAVPVVVPMVMPIRTR